MVECLGKEKPLTLYCRTELHKNVNVKIYINEI